MASRSATQNSERSEFTKSPSSIGNRRPKGEENPIAELASVGTNDRISTRLATKREIVSTVSILSPFPI